MADIPHTLSEFENGLLHTKKSIFLMSSTALENLRNAVRGLLTRDADLCRKAIEEDTAVNGYERDIDEEGMQILLRFNPVATDLRSVVGAMKISTNLERISDEAENIARRAEKILKKPEQSETQWIEPIFSLAERLLEDAMKAYSDGDVDLALGLHERDGELDRAHRKTIKRRWSRTWKTSASTSTSSSSSAASSGSGTTRSTSARRRSTSSGPRTSATWARPLWRRNNTSRQDNLAE